MMVATLSHPPVNPMSVRLGRHKFSPLTHLRPVRVANPEVDVENVETSSVEASKSSSSSSASGNVLPVSAARRALEEEVQRLLAAEDAAYQTTGTSNYRLVESKTHLKSLVNSEAHQATLVVFGSSACRSCRSIEAKIASLAGDNEDILFAKVNTAAEGMAEIAEGLGVPSLPYFLIYSQKELVSSFTANISTIDILRAEISSVKECMGPGCEL